MNIDLIKRLLRQARGSRTALFLTILLGFTGGVLTVIQAGLLSQVIEQVFLEKRTFLEVERPLALILVVIVLRALLVWGSEISSNAIAQDVKASLRQRLCQRLLDLGPIYTRGERTGELTSVMIEGIEALDAYFSQYLPQLALAALVPITFLAFVFPLDALSGMILLVTAPLIPVFMILIGNAAQAVSQRQWQTLSRMSAYFLDVLQGLTTLKILGRSRSQAKVIEQVGERYRQVTMGVLRVTFLSALALEMISTLSTAIVAVEVGLRLLYGRLPFEQALFILILAPEFYLPLRLVGTRFHAGMAGVAAGKRIFEVLDGGQTAKNEGIKIRGERPETRDYRTKDEKSETLRREAENQKVTWKQISFENVCFAYAEERHALRGVSFDIPNGGKVALVGPSGGGKSTLASLLLRFIEPTQGRIMLDGRPLQELAPDVWRQQVAWVPQNPYLFHDTIAANIRLGRPEASLEEVMQAARLAHAHQFITELPLGYETIIGERGAGLSGGQAQRIALARVFLQDSPLLILDEATVNLDPEHEVWLQESLDHLLEGRTALIIAHRLNTVLKADRIVVLKDGQVIESGQHEELVRRKGLYWKMVSAALSGQKGNQAIGGQGDQGSVRPGDAPARDWEGNSLKEKDAPLPAGGHSVSRVKPGTYWRLLNFVRPFAGWVALSSLAGFATIGSSIGLMSASAYIISAAALHPSIAALQMAIVGVRFFGISRGIFRYMERYLSHQVTFRLLARLRTHFYQALEPLAPARLMRYRSGDLLARILGDIATLENFYVRALAPPLTTILVGALAYALLTHYDPGLGNLLLAFLLAAGVGVPWLVWLISKQPGQAIILRRASLSNTIVDGVQGLAELTACNQGAHHLERIRAHGLALAQAQRQTAVIRGFQSALIGLLSNLGMWAVLVAAIPLVVNGKLEGVSLAVVTVAALTSFEAVIPLPAAAQTLGENLQAARRLFEILDAQPEVQDPPAPAPMPAERHLEVKDLRFCYPDMLDGTQTGRREHPNWALNGVSFLLPQGKRLAIVGPSGAGKTALVNLLMRFWEYEHGQITLNGIDLRLYAQEELRGRIALVAQNTYLFSASVGDNLRLARPTASQAEIERAAQVAQIHDFICTLPAGYNTWIGEQGLLLSAGQRQRLAIGRALLKEAPVLILDEPTANLDAITEREILQAIDRLMEGRTTLLITHRLVGMETMDEILVFDQGRVVERGRHAELIQYGGLYWRMWSAQHQWLADSLTESAADSEINSTANQALS